MLNTSSAINFNKDCNYSPIAIGVMQKLVKAPKSSTWDAPTVSAIHQYQNCTNGAGTADGKVGMKTLGCMVRDAYKLGGTAGDTQELQKYPYTQAPNVSFNEVPRFEPRVHAVKAELLMAPKRRWRVTWPFELDLDLSTQIHPTQIATYEYRQYIRGGVWYRYGLQNHWGDWYDANAKGAFKIPGYIAPPPGSGLPAASHNTVGLAESVWKEDGIIRNGVDVRYGYRSGLAMNQPGERDEWITPQQYRLRDTPSVADDCPALLYADQVEVWFEMYFAGYVVELGLSANKFVPKRIVASRTWKCHQSNVILSLR